MVVLIEQNKNCEVRGGDVWISVNATLKGVFGP